MAVVRRRARGRRRLLRVRVFFFLDFFFTRRVVLRRRAVGRLRLTRRPVRDFFLVLRLAVFLRAGLRFARRAAGRLRRVFFFLAGMGRR
ncbi:MAG TPA: hypothetical protein VGA00_11885 [Acidiferrobacterales bacterium]